METRTIFLDTNGNQLGDEDGILPIPLYKSMRVTIHGYSEAFEVVDWSYHHGHAAEDTALRIILRPTS